MTLGHHTRNEAEHYKKAEIKARGNDNYGLPHPHHLHPCQIMGLRVTEVQCQLPHQWHQGPIDLEVPGIQTAANNTAGSLMKINLPVFKDEDTKDAITYQSWHWDLMVYHCTRC